MGFATSK